MTWQELMRNSWQRRVGVRGRGRGPIHQRGQKWSAGIAGQSQSRMRGPKGRVRDRISGRGVSYRNDHEGVVGGLLCYSLALKVLCRG